MPISSLNVAGSISADQLAPHLRKSMGASVSTVIQSTSGVEAPPYIEAIASQAFMAGQAVNLVNGQFVLAKPTSGNLAKAVIAFDCLINERVKAKMNGEILTSYVHGFTSGAQIYLIMKATGSAELNLSNMIGTNEYINGQFIQPIGIAGENQTIYVNIGQAAQLAI